MTGGDWHDPFAQDEEAIERERRRAEREARRRERQGTLGEKVQQQQSETVAAAEQDAAEPATPPTEPSKPPPEPATPPTESATPPPKRPTSTSPPRAPAGPLWIRRALAVLAIVGLVAVAGFGASKVIERIDGDDPPAAAPPKPLKTSEVTIPEGLTRDQIADVAKKAGIKGDYEKATQSFKGFDLASYGAEGAPNLEGFLFPDTWNDLPKKATVKDLISRQLDAFKANLREVDLSYAKSKNLTAYDVLKIASMVEREIQVPEERELAAAVIYNRLAADDTLGIDATIRYEDRNYDEQLTESRLAEDTPYNTRINAGLPPTPIANPGLASIEAAANPAKTDAYYFVIKPGTCGEHVFVESEEEFAQAEAEYQAALQAQGDSPTEC